MEVGGGWWRGYICIVLLLCDDLIHYKKIKKTDIYIYIKRKKEKKCQVRKNICLIFVMLGGGEVRMGWDRWWCGELGGGRDGEVERGGTV